MLCQPIIHLFSDGFTSLHCEIDLVEKTKWNIRVHWSFCPNIQFSIVQKSESAVWGMQLCIDPKGGFYPAQQIVDKADL